MFVYLQIILYLQILLNWYLSSIYNFILIVIFIAHLQFYLFINLIYAQIQIKKQTKARRVTYTTTILLLMSNYLRVPIHFWEIFVYFSLRTCLDYQHANSFVSSSTTMIIIFSLKNIENKTKYLKILSGVSLHSIWD